MISKPEETRSRVITELRIREISVELGVPLLDIPPRGLKSPFRIGKRLVILYALTGLAHNADPKKLLAWLAEIDVDDELRSPERDLFSKVQLSKQEEVDVAWKGESLCVLAWSVHLQDTLDWPRQECSLEALFPRIPPEVDMDGFLKKLHLRNEDDIYFQVDLHYCLHWLLRHPDVSKGGRGVRSVNRDVVLERRTALEWLIGGTIAWDEVLLDT